MTDEIGLVAQELISDHEDSPMGSQLDGDNNDDFDQHNTTQAENFPGQESGYYEELLSDDNLDEFEHSDLLADYQNLKDPDNQDEQIKSNSPEFPEYPNHPSEAIHSKSSEYNHQFDFTDLSDNPEGPDYPNSTALPEQSEQEDYPFNFEHAKEHFSSSSTNAEFPRIPQMSSSNNTHHEIPKFPSNTKAENVVSDNNEKPSAELTNEDNDEGFEHFEGHDGEFNQTIDQDAEVKGEGESEDHYDDSEDALNTDQESDDLEIVGSREVSVVDVDSEDEIDNLEEVYNEDHDTQSNDINLTIPVVLIIKDDRFLLLPNRGETNEETRELSPLFTEQEIYQITLRKFFDMIHTNTLLKEAYDIKDEAEIVLDIGQYLQICEDNRTIDDLRLLDVIDSVHQLLSNSGSPQTLQISISLRQKFVTRYIQLLQAAKSGKSVSQLVSEYSFELADEDNQPKKRKLTE